MSQVLKTHVQIDYHKIRGRIYKLFQDEQLMTSIHQLLYKMCDPYVPMDQGALAHVGVEVTKDYVRYNQPYAHYQYEGILYLASNGSAWAHKDEQKFPSGRMLNYSKEKHAKATRHWDEAMMTEKGQQFCKQVEELVRRRARQLYG